MLSLPPLGSRLARSSVRSRALDLQPRNQAALHPHFRNRAALRFRGKALRAATVWLALLGNDGLHASEAAPVVIAHASLSGGAIQRALLADIFLKEVTRWGDGRRCAPVDQSLVSPVRVAFSKQVLRRSPAAVRRYWQHKMRSGRKTPPPIKTSDTDVIAFVRTTPGAVGYVAADTDLPEGVKKLKIL